MKKFYYYNKLLKDKDAVIKRYRDGQSCDTISKSYDCHSHTVRKFLIKHGVKLRPAGGGHLAKKESMKNGYKVVAVARGYPKKYSNGGMMYYEHILVLEKKLGRFLKDRELGHHIDLDKLNNSENNLIECTPEEHMAMHRQLDNIVSKLIKSGVITFSMKDKKYDSTWVHD